MSSTLATQLKKHAQHVPAPARSQESEHRSAPPQSTDRSAFALGGHTFGRIQLHSDALAAPTAQSCSKGYTKPSLCPFGGACHTCPSVVQAKLTVGRPDDEYEEEADRIAERIMRMASPDGDDEPSGLSSVQTPTIGRSCPTCEDDDDIRRQPLDEDEAEDEGEEDDILQARPASGGGLTVSSALQNRISSMRDGGQPLPESVRSFFEPRFGHELGEVRIHTDGRAAETALGVNARAYTIGRDVVFGPGQYKPGTQEGQRLLAHEFTHVLQQRGPGAGTRSPEIGGGDVAHGQAPSQQPNRLVRQTSDTGRIAPVMQTAPDVTIMRAQLYSSTMEICHRLLQSRRFRVSQGGIMVTANAEYERRGTPECSTTGYHMTLNRQGLILDSEYGTCGFPQGRPFSRQWTDLPNGEYYLTIWTNNTNPYCCLVGDIIVEERSGLRGESCTHPPPGPLEILHSALDLAGLIPALGAVPDAINAGIYAIQGDWMNVGLSAIAIVPVFGDAATVGRIGTRTILRVTGEGVERVGREGIAAGLREARASRRAVGEATEGLAHTRSVDREVEEAVESAFREGRVTSGEPLELIGHGSASEARTARGQSGRQIQSAHGAPQSAMRTVSSYDPDAALTRLLPRQVHRDMDRYWKQRARQLAAQGRTTWPAQEMFEVVSESIRRTPGLSDAEKFSHIQRLQDEIFVEWGLRATDLVRLPFSR